MRNDEEQPAVEVGSEETGSIETQTDAGTSRRNMLRIAALGGAAIVTVQPGIAQAAVSALKCTIPVPDAANSTKWIKNSDGSLVASGSGGAIAGPSAPLKGEDVKNSLNFGTTYPGYTSAQTTTWNKYINKLTSGKQGYTCLASVKNPV